MGCEMKQITIYELLPLLKKGWVAYSPNGHWNWYNKKPDLFGNFWLSQLFDYPEPIKPFMFNIAPFDGDPKDSLIKVEHKEEDNRGVKI